MTNLNKTSNKKNLDNNSVEQINNQLNKFSIHQRSFTRILKNNSTNNLFRKSFNKFLFPYLITLNKLFIYLKKALILLTKNQQDLKNKQEGLENYQNDNFNQLIKNIENIENINNKKINFLNNIQILSIVAKQNALQEKQAFLFNKILIKKSFIETNDASQRIFYSQFAEDQWIVENVPDLPKKGFFIDVGAADGVTFSNTYYFEKRGWTGLCFEPSPFQYQQAKLFRKRVLPLAISDIDGKINFYTSKSFPDWSSTIKSDDSLSVTKVESRTLKSIINKNKIKKIDLLSIDVEGSELAVLKGFPFNKIEPSIIIVEYLNKINEKNREIEPFMKKLPYNLVYKTFANLIYVKK